MRIPRRGGLSLVFDAASTMLGYKNMAVPKTCRDGVGVRGFNLNPAIKLIFIMYQLDCIDKY